MNCPHQTSNDDGTIWCAIAAIQAAGPAMPNYPCDACRAEWTNGPPTREQPTPTVQTLIMPAQTEVWDVTQPSKGLGDTIAKITHKLGIRKRKGCKCARRQAWLNRLVPYRRV